MGSYAGDLERLESSLLEMGRGMIYVPTGDYTSAILKRVRESRTAPPRRFPVPWPVAPRPVVIIALTLLLVACAAAAAYFALYPVPKGFDITVGFGHTGGDAFVVTADDMERLVSSPSNDSGVTWSPDCSRIAFISNRPNPRSSNYRVWVVKADGSDPVKITHGPHLDFATRWSPDGTRIAFRRSEMGEGSVPPRGWPPLKSMDIFVINADGSGETRLTDGPGLKGDMSWSPDGKRMLLGLAQLQSPPRMDTLTWGIDEETWEIYVMNSDGTDMKNLSNRPGKDINASWSPDGRLIVFESTRGDGTEDIYVMNADSSNIRRLTDDPAADMLPRWSPDGKWISFTSRRPVGPERRLQMLRAKVEAEGIEVSEDILKFMAKQGANGGDANVWMMKADGSEVQHVVEGWGGGWPTCKAQR